MTWENVKLLEMILARVIEQREANVGEIKLPAEVPLCERDAVMTSQTLPRQQRVPTRADQNLAVGVGVHVGPSPITEMTTVQFAIEGAKEQIEETRICQPTGLTWPIE